MQSCRLRLHHHVDGNVVFEVTSTRVDHSTPHEYQVVTELQWSRHNVSQRAAKEVVIADTLRVLIAVFLLGITVLMEILHVCIHAIRVCT